MFETIFMTNLIRLRSHSYVAVGIFLLNGFNGRGQTMPCEAESSIVLT